MRPRPPRFTPQDDAYICEHYGKTPVGDIARHLGRPGKHSIRKRAVALGLSRPYVAWSAEEDAALVELWRRRERLSNAERELGRSGSACQNRIRTLKLGKWRRERGPRTHAGRLVRAFVNGSALYEHRAVMAEVLGRPLRSDEIVHHIDADKHNNRADNLVLLTRSEHRTAHSSLEAIVPALLRSGIVRFDVHRKEYVLCETRR